METPKDNNEKCVPRTHSSFSHQEDHELATGDKSTKLQQQLGMDKNVPPVSQDMTPEEEELSHRINRKMDLAMLPMLSLLYLFNGLDKGNIGNAETQGMLSLETPLDFPVSGLTKCIGFTKDIGAKPNDLNLAVSLFFITFVLFQPPSAAVGRWIGPRYWIPAMTVNKLPLSLQNH